MTKKIRFKVEQALYDIKVARKMIKKATEDLESSISSRDNKIAWLDEQLTIARQSIDDQMQGIRDEYESLFQEIFGENVDRYLEGFRFERHIVWWMNKNFPQYELKIWQGDKCYKPYEDSQTISASWNTYPDLIYVDEKQKRVVALECKYRYDGILNLDRRQYENYKRFETRISALMGVDAKVYIMAGSRGETSGRPDYVYCIPIGYFDKHDSVDFRYIPEYKVYERGLFNIIEKNIPF